MPGKDLRKDIVIYFFLVILTRGGNLEENANFYQNPKHRCKLTEKEGIYIRVN